MSKHFYKEQKALPQAPVDAESVNFRSILPPKSLTDIWQYLSMKERQPDGQIFEGYQQQVFPRLQKGLEGVYFANTGRTSEVGTTRLRLRPPAFYHNPGQAFGMQEKKVITEVNSGEKIHLHSDMPDATQALMELTYSYTKAEQIGVDEDDKTGTSRVLLRGEHRDYPLFFIETRGYDGYGEYLTWDVTDSPPEELMPQLSHDHKARHFFVHSERVSAMEEHIVDVESWPTVEIDEEAVVQSWISSQSDHRKVA